MHKYKYGASRKQWKDKIPAQIQTHTKAQIQTHIKAQIQTHKKAQIQIRNLKEAMEGRDPGGQNRQSESTGACRAC